MQRKIVSDRVVQAGVYKDYSRKVSVTENRTVTSSSGKVRLTTGRLRCFQKAKSKKKYGK